MKGQMRNAMEHKADYLALVSHRMGRADALSVVRQNVKLGQNKSSQQSKEKGTMANLPQQLRFPGP